MASFRKSSSKTRATLESSTALPPEPGHVLTHVGEQAARLTDPVRPGKPKASRKPVSDRVAVLETAGAFVETAPRIAATDDVAEILAASAAAEPAPAPSLSVVSPESPASEVVDAAEPSVSEPPAAAWASDAEAEAGSLLASSADRVVPAGTEDMVGLADETVQEVPDDRPAPSPELSADQDAPRAPAAPGFVDRTPWPLLGAVEASETLIEFQTKLAEHIRDYLEESVAFVAGMGAARSLPEAFRLNARHIERRLQAVSSQSRDWTVLAGKLTGQALMPFAPLRLP